MRNIEKDVDLEIEVNISAKKEMRNPKQKREANRRGTIAKKGEADNLPER